MFSSQSSGAVNAAVNAVSNVATGTVNAVSNVASGAVNAVSNVATGTVNAVSDVATGAVNAANDVFKSVNTATNTAINSISQSVPLFNSLLPIGNTSTASAAAPANTGFFNMYAKNSAKSAAENNSKAVANNFWNSKNSANSAKNYNIIPQASSWLNPLYIFAGIVLIFLILFSLFNRQIKDGYEYAVANARKVLGMNADPDVTAAVHSAMPVVPVTVPPQAPQDITPDEKALPQISQQGIVERILPTPGQEVFNVAQNKFTYYDAEPLCRALGAELATYEQVKDAWGNGADWCNYGWVKGQMAVYPTQKETYEKLQAGPADQHNSCGTVGINGGYFDNPEFKYGVNCYGKKPPQSAHDQAMLMSEGKAPKSPDALKIDKMVAEFKDEVDSLFVKPFNNQKWVSA